MSVPTITYTGATPLTLAAGDGLVFMTGTTPTPLTAVGVIYDGVSPIIVDLSPIGSPSAVTMVKATAGLSVLDIVLGDLVTMKPGFLPGTVTDLIGKLGGVASDTLAQHAPGTAADVLTVTQLKAGA